MKKLYKITFIGCVVVFAACRKPYNPPAIASPGNFLVVEGVINTAGITNITLSNTVNLSSTGVVNPVTGASVTVQGSQGAGYTLTETTPGYYQSASLNLANTQNYRVSIKTSDGQQYYSDYAAVSVSPPIDSIGYNIVGNGLQVYVNTHDATNQTKYYRWDYNETWQFHSEYQSLYISDGHELVLRTAAQNVYSCFTADTSNVISLASTAHLSQAVVNQNVLTTIPSTSEKIESEYSIQVNQYALTGDAYNYWANLKEDTENLGSIFDPQPSNFSGNIHSASNPATTVVGYMSVCAVQTKRVFINNALLPKTWNPVYPNACQVDSDYYSEPVNGINEVQLSLLPLSSPVIPIGPFFKSPNFISPVGFLATDAICADCTVRGTKTVPAFWPQ